MQDQITALCRKLLGAQDPEELRPVAEKLQGAIHERVDGIRETAIELAIISRMIDHHIPSSTELQAKENSRESHPSAV